MAAHSFYGFSSVDHAPALTINFIMRKPFGGRDKYPFDLGPLSEDVARRDAPVRSHELASYDRLVQAAQPAPGREEHSDE